MDYNALDEDVDDGSEEENLFQDRHEISNSQEWEYYYHSIKNEIEYL